MNENFYKLTDVMTIIYEDGEINKPIIPPIDLNDDNEKLSNTPKKRSKIASQVNNPYAIALTEDELIEKDFIDDGGYALLSSISEKKLIERIKRYQQAVKLAKTRRGYTCQICGESSDNGSNFVKDNGVPYCEAHHIKPLSQDGSQDALNIIILCANHHRMFHYAKSRIAIGELIEDTREITINGKLYIVSFD